MHKEVIVGVPHLIENEQPNEQKKNALYGQPIEQKWKTYQVHDDSTAQNKPLARFKLTQMPSANARRACSPYGCTGG